MTHPAGRRRWHSGQGSTRAWIELADGRPRAVVGDGTLRLDLLTGNLLTGSPGIAAWRDREVVLGIRPERITEPDRRAHPDIMQIEAGVEMTEPTGAETVVSLRLAGEGALARVAPDMRLPIGANAGFAVATRSICLFDPETEMLIA